MLSDDAALLRSLSNIDILGLTLYGEARGEPVEGIIAVGCVIRNRGTNYHDIVLAPDQFSCWNSNDTNYPILIELAKQLIMGEMVDNIFFRQCLFIASGIISNSLVDNTHGSRHYVSNFLFQPHNRPSWAGHPTNVKAIGNQVFFNA